ncbi:hypothetical protein [Raineyella fluvialis]|uniref:DUF2567 domain-containing protein n=1 Tax=Raineyella fluvialis TaxID=2662261 RepID=A0A5Q2FIL8_9ACTN|nr:hypothetical protein [Raineyella fluvialis]QGF24495.1 hypothetical protein Rai3103_13490 [Raineyella fluvialis]
MTRGPLPPSLWGPYAGYGLASVLLGCLGGVVWRTTTPLPGYTVGPDEKAVISELGLTQLFVADARYALIAMAGGLLLGVLAVVLLRHLGVRIVLWAVIGPVLAGLAAWAAGVVGATPLKDRLAVATAGRTEPVDLALNAPVAVLLWPFLAILVVLLWSAFAPEPTPVVAARSVEGTDLDDLGTEQPDQVSGGDLELQ